MEAQSNIEKLNRIQKIAYSKIPISEESPLYDHFLQRRDICKNLLSAQEGTYKDTLLTGLYYIEDGIKKYLCL